MNSYNSSIDSGLPRKNSCESHVSVYYEQDQQKELWTVPHPMYSCSSDEKVYENPPVEINDEDTTSIDLPPLTWHGYENAPKLLTVTNTGRTILINGHWTNIRPYIDGGPLNGTYLFSQIHFHCPSEHEINGKRFPLEMHIVHYKTSYLTQERAMQEKDGTVVLVYLFQLLDTRETVVSQITKLGCQLKEVNSRTESTEISLDKLITPFFSNYYIYWGSLTTKKNKYLLQWIINCNVLGVTQQEVEDLSNIITSTVGLTVKQTPRLKPEYDAIYHVGEADYSLPPLKTSSTNDVCTVCKHYEVPYVSCACKLEKVEYVEADGNGTPSLQLVCECKSKTQACVNNCKKLADKYVCSKCKSVGTSSCSKCCEGREGILSGKIFYSRQIKPRKKAKVYCDIKADGPDGGLILKCKNKSLLMAYYKNIKKKQRKIKKKKSRKPKKSSEGESEKSSSKSSMGDDRSRDKLDSGAESGESEVEQKPKKDIRFEDEKENPESVEERKVKKKKKKKKEKGVIESIVSLKKDQSKTSLKTITELPRPGPSSSGLISFSPKSSTSVSEGMQKEKKKLCSSKSSANDTDEAEEENKKLNSPESSANVVQETEEKKKIDNAETPEVKIAQTCEIIEQSPSVILLKESKNNIGKENKKANSSKDGTLKSPVGSRSTKSRSKTRTNVEKTKDPESSERKNLAVRKSKSKSPVSEIFQKNKASMKKESERSEYPDSKVVMSDGSKSKMAKSKTVSETAKSAQEVKCPVTKSIPGIENLKSDIAPPKDMKTRSIKLRKKLTEEGKGKSKADSEGQTNKQEYDITTIFEKKPEGKKAQSLAGDCNDVKVNFLLSPGTSIRSDPSSALRTSESDFTEEKKQTLQKRASEDCEKSRDHFSQEFTVNTATIAESEFPPNKLKEHPKGCLLMEHIFRRSSQDTTWSSQEYHVAIMYDQYVLQEYRGKFHPQELRLGDYEQLVLVPKYPEPENFNFRLQDCFVKKESLDQICVRVKFLLKDLSVLPVFENRENRLSEISEKKEKLLFDQQTQCSLKELNVVTSCVSKSIKENKIKKKILDAPSSEILMNEYKLENKKKEKQQSKSEEEQKGQLKNEEKQKQQSKNKSIHWENEIAEPQKCTYKRQNDSNVYSQDASQSSVTEQFSTDSSLKENKIETERSEKKLTQSSVTEQFSTDSSLKENKIETDLSEKKLTQSSVTEQFSTDSSLKGNKIETDLSEKKLTQSSVTEQFSTDSSLKENKIETERSEKKLKSLFVKRRKTVYFMYDRVEKDEGTGKKVFVGSFKTKEEVDNLKKQKAFQEKEATSAGEKSEETYEAKCFVPFENKKADLKVTILDETPALKSSSSGKNSPSTSQDTSNRNKDVVTLHKYKPKHSETNQFKRDCKNGLPGKVMDNSQRNIESSRHLTSVCKGKASKTSVHELCEPSESESQKLNSDPDAGKAEKKSKAKNAVLNKSRGNYYQSEVKVLEKSSKAEEDLARDNSQKSLDKKESQAALILIPVEAESLSKTEVILIEQLDKLKKDKKKLKTLLEPQ